jgi:hypothetical protein
VPPFNATLHLSFNAAAKIKIFSLSNTLNMKMTKNIYAVNIPDPAGLCWSPRNT